MILELGGHKENMFKFAGESPLEVCKEEGELFDEVLLVESSSFGKDPKP